MPTVADISISHCCEVRSTGRRAALEHEEEELGEEEEETNSKTKDLHLVTRDVAWVTNGLLESIINLIGLFY